MSERFRIQAAMTCPSITVEVLQIRFCDVFSASSPAIFHHIPCGRGYELWTTTYPSTTVVVISKDMIHI